MQYVGAVKGMALIHPTANWPVAIMNRLCTRLQSEPLSVGAESGTIASIQRVLMIRNFPDRRVLESPKTHFRYCQICIHSDLIET